MLTAYRFESVKYPNDSEVFGKDYHFAGRLSLDMLAREKYLFVEKRDRQYFICGLESFMSDMSRSLKDMGARDDQIKLDIFGRGAVN